MEEQEEEDKSVEEEERGCFAEAECGAARMKRNNLCCS